MKYYHKFLGKVKFHKYLNFGKIQIENEARMCFKVLSLETKVNQMSSHLQLRPSLSHSDAVIL